MAEQHLRANVLDLPETNNNKSRHALAVATSLAAAVILNARVVKWRPLWRVIFFAPFDNPRYAGAVVIEHGGGSGAAYPIARDVMTYIFDQGKVMAVLEEFEKQWGGNVQQRMAARYASYAEKYGASAPKPVPDDDEAQVRAPAGAQHGVSAQQDVDALAWHQVRYRQHVAPVGAQAQRRAALRRRLGA